ncbi:MAG: hypothetical protein JWL59_3445 [Chthoniobacteraceae bacterium]|nr:hypothetical protein [Chthoniobacteraceae bacterium]
MDNVLLWLWENVVIAGPSESMSDSSVRFWKLEVSALAAMWSLGRNETAKKAILSKK